MRSQMPSGHGKKGILVFWLADVKGEPFPNKRNKRAPLGNRVISVPLQSHPSRIIHPIDPFLASPVKLAGNHRVLLVLQHVALDQDIGRG